MSNFQIKAQSNFVYTDAIQTKFVTYITVKGQVAKNGGKNALKVSRAKKGGAVSSINGEFYKGGWYMPKENVRELDLHKVAHTVL